MASRKEQKERLRRERVARQEAAAANRARRQRIRIGAAVLGAAGVLAVVVVLISSSGGGGSTDRVTGRATPIPAGAKVGLETTPAPWPPEWSHLAERLGALKFPRASDSAFHIHALLSVFVNGKQEPVPANVGIDPGFRFMAPLHTHDNSGLVHIESSNRVRSRSGSSSRSGASLSPRISSAPTATGAAGPCGSTWTGGPSPTR